MHDVLEQMEQHHVLVSVQQEQYEIEVQDRVRNHEHVRHVQQEIIVDERMISMHVQMEHIDDQQDERQKLIVHHVQQEK